MDELNTLIKPMWGAEKWILEGWNKINETEKASIKQRLDDLFKDGLPFKLHHDKLLYVYTFALCAQLECLAIQVPLRFEEKMETPEFKQQMRRQLLDEIFHAIVFTKVVYMLSAPAAFPPEYNTNIEIFCDFIRNEQCPKIGVVLLNLVAEGWIEGFFRSLYQQNIAPNVMSVILEDESRHVHEADLYRTIGLPNVAVLRDKLESLEGLMLTHFMLEPKYFLAFTALLGSSAAADFFENMNKSHVKQLKKINMVPSKRWQREIQMGPALYGNMFPLGTQEIPMTPVRQIFMTQWNEPGDPTMVGQFNLDISSLEFYSKKYPPETLNTLMLQAISQILTKNAAFRTYLSFKKLYQSNAAYVGVVVKLPGCGAHTGTITYKNCHLMAAPTLAIKIRQALEMMVYCYQKREAIEKIYPHLRAGMDHMLFDCAYGAYPYPIPGNAIASVSNIGPAGFSTVISPLRRTEGLKFTLLAVEKKLLWNNETSTFDARDILPISLSSDHRVFDGNWPIPKLLAGCFDEVFQRMLADGVNPLKNDKFSKTVKAYFIKKIDTLLTTNLEAGYQMLVMLQTHWPDYMDIKTLFKKQETKEPELVD